MDDWYGDSGEEDSPPPYDTATVLKSETSVALSGLLTEQQLKSYYIQGKKKPFKHRKLGLDFLKVKLVIVE